MKSTFLLFILLIFGFSGAKAQSFVITPSDGYINSASPDIELTGTLPPEIRGRRSSGTQTSPIAITNNNSMLQLVGAGNYGGFLSDQVLIGLKSSQNWTSSARGSKISFSTTQNGSITMQEKMVLSDQGYLGLNTTAPQVPFHVNLSFTGTSSTNGAVVFGPFAGSHLNFTRNLIDSWRDDAGETLFLNYYSQGKVVIGNGPSGSDLEVNGYTNLGDGAPKIKMKKLTGTTASSEGISAAVAHGLNVDKILDVRIFIETSPSNYVPDNAQYGSSGSTFELSATYLYVRNVYGRSSGILSKPFKAIITYEE